MSRSYGTACRISQVVAVVVAFLVMLALLLVALLQWWQRIS